MPRKNVFVAILLLSVMMVFTGCNQNASKSTSSAVQSISSSTQESSSLANSSNSSVSHPASSGTGEDSSIHVQSTVKTLKPSADYIVGWLNGDTLLYSHIEENVYSLRVYTPKTGTDSAFITKGGASIFDAAISPDRSYLAYALTDAKNQSQTYDLCVMDLKTKAVKTLYKGIIDLEWVDNSRILFTSGENTAFMTDLSGHLTNLTQKIGGSEKYTYRYGPIINNRLYYLESQTMQLPGNLYATDITTGKRALVIQNADSFFPSPNNEYAFVELTSDSSHHTLELINLNGQVEKIIGINSSTSREGDVTDVSWSSDGTSLAYSISSNNQKNAGLYIYNLKANTSTKIENNVYGSTYSPVIKWNPTINALAFSNKSGSNCVFKVFYLTDAN